MKTIAMSELIILFSVVFGILTTVVNVLFAFAVFKDATKVNHHPNGKPVLVDGITWTISTLLGGVFVASIYWVIHHSTLNPNKINKG